jgi:hypothetical protein
VISIFGNDKEKEREQTQPSPTLRAMCPTDGKILAFYEGLFEAVYILLHPFIKADSIDPNRFYPESYPTKAEILANCSPVSWSEVIRLTELQNINEVDIGLRTAILGLKDEFTKPGFADAINKLEETSNIIRPSEGDIPELLQNKLFDAIQKSGNDQLWIADEFGEEQKLEWIDDLKVNYELPSHGNIFTSDKSLLITTHWDSHFSFICSTRDNIATLLDFSPLEGFYCDESTEVYWSLRTQVYACRIDRRD